MVNEYKSGEKAFNTLICTITELVPAIRFYQRDIKCIQEFKNGFYLLDAKGERIASVSKRTLYQNVGG